MFTPRRVVSLHGRVDNSVNDSVIAAGLIRRRPSGRSHGWHVRHASRCGPRRTRRVFELCSRICFLLFYSLVSRVPMRVCEVVYGCPYGGSRDVTGGPCLCPVGCLLFCVVDLLSLATYVRRRLPPRSNFTLRRNSPLPRFDVSGPSKAMSGGSLRGGFTLVVFFDAAYSSYRGTFPSVSALCRACGSSPSIYILLVTHKRARRRMTACFQRRRCGVGFFTSPSLGICSLFTSGAVPHMFLTSGSNAVVLARARGMSTKLLVSNKMRPRPCGPRGSWRLVLG